jgi:hypothetical protein
MKSNNDQEPSRIEMSEKELSDLIQEVNASSLSEKSKVLIVRVLSSFLWLNRQLERKTLSIKKLLRIFFGAKTEKVKKEDTKKDNDDKPTGASAGNKADPKPPGSKGKGHGKTGQAEFKSAEHITVPHPTLSVKDECPSCKEGRLYDFGPANVLRIFGQSPLIAKVFELGQLRCANCQELFTAPLPAEAGPDRNHVTANAMIACLNYGTGMPFYRLESLQKQLGTPVPDSTQFDMSENAANCGAPVFEHMKKLAPNGQQHGLDDTPVKVLSLMTENKKLSKNDRTGMQTSAFVVKHNENKMALFMTGRNHAGENAGALLAKRDPTLPKVVQMSEASPNNFSHDFMELVIMSLCLDHGRRNFHDIMEAFPKDCRHVIQEIGRVYKNDANSKLFNLTPAERLIYHKEHSSPIMNGLNTWMEEKLENKEVEPNSELGKAIEYFLKHWNGLTAFIRVEGAPLSNAEVERLIKRCVLRRKASMFFRTEVGAWIGDVLMSLIETARFAGKKPFEYLVALQENAVKVRRNPENWLPWNYQQTLLSV